jgi:hypothetical protein
MRLNPVVAAFVLAVVALISAAPVLAQSPNTASMVVTVVDQNGAVVEGASVTVTNTATGATRDAVSGDEGTVTFAGLPLTGEYKVSVKMTGFTADDATD